MIKNILLIIFLLVVFFGSVNISLAATGEDRFYSGLRSSGSGAGFDITKNGGMSVFSKIGFVVEVLLSVIGVMFLILMMYGGFKWMKAMGNDQEVTAGKNIVINATIGLIIVVSAYAVTAFVRAKFNETGVTINTQNNNFL